MSAFYTPLLLLTAPGIVLTNMASLHSAWLQAIYI